MTIIEFNEKDKIEMPLLVSNVTQGITSAGAPYLSITLQDKTASIEAKLWDAKAEDIARVVSGKVFLVAGEVLKYRQQLQLRVARIEPVLEPYDLLDFVKQHDVPIEQLKSVVQQTLASLQDPVLKAVTTQLFEKHEHDFFEYPAAAKNHHDFMGGLAMHVVGMLNIAEFLCQQYPLLNRDLLVAGILLHDLGKIFELSGPIVTEYTLQGKLLGHISLMHALVYEQAHELALQHEESIILLSHMILAHHGKYEYGSPVLPLIPEAEVLHFIDNLDARLNMFEKMIETTEPGSFSTRIFSLENRSFYRSK